MSESAARIFETEWRAEVRASSPQQLANEAGLLWTFWRTKQEAASEEPELVVPDNPAITYALLKSARSEMRSQSMGNRAVRLKPRLAWDVLVELHGDEDVLRGRIEQLKASPPDEIGDLLELADKYLSGWRPKDFGDEK